MSDDVTTQIYTDPSTNQTVVESKFNRKPYIITSIILYIIIKNVNNALFNYYLCIFYILYI